MQGRDILILNLTSWDYPMGNNCCNIAREMARDNRVLYVNPPLDRITSLRHREDPLVQKRRDILAGKRAALEEVEENLWVLYPPTLTESINWLPDGWLYDRLNQMNNRRLANAIQPFLTKLGFRNFLAFNDNDIVRTFHMKEMLNPVAYLYYIRDQLIAIDYWKRHGVRVEARHIEKSEAVVANSVYLAEYARRFNPHSVYVGQGCKLDAWDPALVGEKPADLRIIPGPVIGYVGAIDGNRLDPILIRDIADARPDWSLVMVGPERDESFRAAGLHERKNVVFLGAKPPEQLPDYVAYFDVCINPQTVNELTIGNYPRKIDEYLAMGKPTVATRTQAMSVFETHVALVDDAPAYVTAIQDALNNDSAALQTARRTFAAEHTWENNVKEIYRVMEQVLKGSVVVPTVLS